MKPGIRLLLILIFNFLLLTSDGSTLHYKGISNKTGETNFVHIDSIPFQNNQLLNFNSYFILLSQNLKQEFTKPFHFKKKDWGNFGKYAVITIALSFADEPVQQAALRLRNRNTRLNIINRLVN